MATAAAGATIDSIGSSHVVRIDWTDGKRSLIKLPDSMYKHLQLVLQAQRAEHAEPTPAAEAISTPADKPTVTEQAFSLVSGIVKDRFPARTATTSLPVEPAQAAQPDVAEQLTKLASLRDAGILTEDEFSAKKAELLARF